jgi:isocitrate dehydrogenase
MANNPDDAELAARFKPVAEALAASEDKIVEELLAAQGSPAEIGGYYQPADDLATAAMRPSATLNAIIDNV